MAARPRIEAAHLARLGRLRRALPALGQGALGILVCALWLGLASPGLQLLPGVGGLADESIEISLQSAMLGIEDASGRPDGAAAREAADVLGIAFAQELLTRPAHANLPANGIVRLDTQAMLATASPSTPDEESAAVPDAPSPQSEAPPAADSPPVPVAVAAVPVRSEPAPRAPAPAPKPAPKADPVVVPAPAAPGAQTVVFAELPPDNPVAGAEYDVSAWSSSGLPVKLSVVSGGGVCSIAGGTLVFHKAGACVVVASQAGNGTFAAAETRREFLVGRAAQAVAFTSEPPAPAHTGGQYAAAAAASSGLPVTLVASGACAVRDGVVRLDAAGLCTVRAEQAGDATRLPASAEQSFTVSLAPVIRLAQSIAFTSSAPTGAAWNGASYAVTAAASSGLPVSFSLASASAGVCTLSGSTVSLTGIGTCTILADQGGSSSWLAAAQVQQSFAVGKASQSVSFSSTAPSGAVYGGASYVVAASASSGLAVSFSIAPASAGVCSLSGSTVSMTGVGTCTVRADQAGDASYDPAPQVQQSFAVGKASQSVSFTSSAPSGAVYGGASYVVAASASSGLAVSFSIAPASAGVCSLSGSTVSMTGVGTCTVRADQAGDASYDAAPQVQQSFAVGQASQSVSFTSSAPSNATIGGTAYAVAASASSGLAPSFSIAPASAGVCSLAGASVSFVGAGTCTVRADQAGNANYAAAPQVQQSFAVAKAAQTVGFTSTAPSGAVYGGASYVVAASASSGLAVTFSIAPASAGVCSLSGSTVSMTGAGTCTVRADQAGNATYEAAPQVEQSFTVAKAPQSVSFTSTAPSGAVYGGASYTVAATATSGLAVSFSIAPASASVCSVTGSTVSMTGAGTCTVRADQAGNANYDAAPQVQQSFAVAKASQTITFTSTPPVVDEDVWFYNVSATATSGLAVGFSTPSAGVCSVFGSWVVFHGNGTCHVWADQPGDENWNPAPRATQSIPVNGHDDDDDD